MDQAIWAIWYDLDDADRAPFLDWLHAKYLPALALSPAFTWVAQYAQTNAPPQSVKADGSLSIGRTDEDVGTGHRYMTLIGAPTPRVFLNPLFAEAEAKAIDGAAAFLAMRRGLRRNLFVEQQRVLGSAPGAAEHPTVLSAAIQFGTFRMRTPENEFELNAFYEQNRLPAMARSARSIRTRKLVSVAGWAKHGVIYEFDSIAGRNEVWAESARRKKDGDPAEQWQISHNTLHTPGSPVTAERTWPPVK